MTYYKVTRNTLRSFFSSAWESATGLSRSGAMGNHIDALHSLSSAPGENHDAISAFLDMVLEADGRDLWTRRAEDETPGEGEWVLYSGQPYTNKVFVQLAEPADTTGWIKYNISPERIGGMHEGEYVSSEVDVIITPLDGWGSGYAEVRPNEEAMQALSAGAQPFAQRVVRRAENSSRWYIYTPGESFTEGEQEQWANLPTARELVNAAREVYRATIRARIGRPNQDAENARLEAIQAHREQTSKNFEAFVRGRNNDTEAHIGKLPFVPHGLSSSRRWGIEIEHPGARGVQAPSEWESKGDGSLRSAYDGYVEVQDFEPYEREEMETVPWSFCSNAALHDPRVAIFDDQRGEYLYEPNPDYVSAADCTECGAIVRRVLVEPQTIHHTARGGDCKEFVSPILVSMHSNGLEELMNDLKGRPTNSSAGVHVHVEADDLSPDQIATLVYGYDILEPILEASYKRDRRDFCERRDVSEVLNAARKAKRKDGTFNYYDGGRYRTLNTHSMGDHGTIEFRAMGPVYDYDYLVRWAMLCREIVNSVANGATTKDFANIQSWDDLVMFIAKFGKEYVRAAVYEMTGETGSQAALSKGNQPVTQSALDADLEALLSPDFTPITTAFNRMAETIARLGVNSDNLVGVGGYSET